MRSVVRRYASNVAVVVVTALPNLVITLGTQTVLDVFLGWQGVYALVAYLIGQVLSVQYSIMFHRGVNTTFTVGRYAYTFAKQERQTPPGVA